MHSNRLPGSNDDALRAGVQVGAARGHRVSKPTSGDTGLPHWAQRTTSRKPGMLMFFGPSCEIRRAPAGAPGSGGFRAAGLWRALAVVVLIASLAVLPVAHRLQSRTWIVTGFA